MSKCKYPNCCNEATKTFALVDLCERHFDLIMDETKLFYAREIVYHQRIQYLKISSLIPCSKENEDPWKDERRDMTCVL